MPAVDVEVEEVGPPSSKSVDCDGEVERTKKNKITKKKVKKAQGKEDVSKHEEIPDTITKEDTMISKDLPPQNDSSCSSSSSSGVNKSKTIFSDKNFIDLPISEMYELILFSLILCTSKQRLCLSGRRML